MYQTIQQVGLDVCLGLSGAALGALLITVAVTLLNVLMDEISEATGFRAARRVRAERCEG